ncbi:uncharacterized protein LOC128883114 [Hylaeus volcanicus]|uniref:uncharacterized protein LOC128883114 n=1 Tax=Hylaeus volcanicus TaxID=313075 RepID=UPI0023B84711|nr:uncharacterized protein LOC128883114 [Hylaeus volcanicus]
MENEELGKFQIRYQYQWNTESAEVPLDNSSNNKPLLGCSFGHAKKADTISIEASYLKLRYALGPFTIEQMTNPANEKKVSNSFIKCGLTVAILLNSECMGILGLMNVFQKASQMEEAELWDSLKKDNPKHNDLNFENSNDLHIDTKPFIEISFLSKMPKYLLILSPYTFIIVPLFESNETVDSKNVHITDAVIITHSKCFYSVNLAELCLFTSDARSLDNTKLPIHRLVTVKDLMESSTTFPSYTSCWFLNKPTVDCSFFEIDLRDYHWIIINSLLYLLVPRYKGAVYTVQLVLHPSSLKLYGIHIKPFLKETLYFFCDSPPVLYTSESHHSTCMILLPGHPNEANPPSLWNIQFDYFWGTPPNENSATEQTRVSTSTIESFFWGHRLHTIDPIKILPLLRKSWSPILKSKKDASVLSCNTFLSGSHGNLRKEKLSSGSLGSC